MPRKKKSDQSPARVPGGPPEVGSPDQNTGRRGPHEFDSAMAGNFPSSAPLSNSDKERIIKGMQEMFSHLDPDVIYIVLAECDFKVEHAMDSLLELSIAAEGAAPGPSPISGFERTVSALLSPQLLSNSGAEADSTDHCSDSLREELDLLVDQELETRTIQQEQHISQNSSSPLISKQDLPELLQSSLQLESGSQGSQMYGASSVLDPPSTWENESVIKEKPSMDFTQLMAETPTDKPKPSLDLGASGRPSAFQVYKKQQPFHMSVNTAVGGARAKVSVLTPEPSGYLQSPLNIDAPVFTPHVGQNQGPAFIIPVAQLPSNLTNQPQASIPWPSHRPISIAPLRPSATIPKSWALPVPHNRLRLHGRVLVLLRGAPGSGKSTLARALMEHNPGAVILSTDDYFTHNGDYQFNPNALGDAHESNHKRAKEAFQRGSNPIIIDNTNLQGWEMRPYVIQAVKHGYKVLFREPDTWWRYKPRELMRRTTHDVPLETIRHMLSKYERVVSVQSILGPQMEFQQCHLLEDESSELLSSETHCPDIVGQPELSHPHLFSSLPDVSSTGLSGEMGLVEDGACRFTELESLNFQPTGTAAENPEMPEMDKDIDSDEVKCELDAQLELHHLTVDQTIPDCLVESVMNEDQQGDEMSAVFSETIGQRVRRERPSRRSCLDNLEPADLVKYANQSDRKLGDKERSKEEETQTSDLLRHEGVQGIPQMDFTGDWPCEGFLQQRQVRKRREGCKERHENTDEAASRSNETQNKLQPEADKTEFQKLLDLIQTDVADIQMDNFSSSSLSSSSEEELEPNKEEAYRCYGSSSSKEKEQDMLLNRSHGELPDFVLDQKMNDSSNTTVALMDDWGVPKAENDVNINKESHNETGSLALKPAITSPLLSPDISSLALSDTVEADVHCGDDMELDTTVTEVDGSTHTSSVANVSQNSNFNLSPVCGNSVGAESSSCIGGNQERKQHQGRRSGKQCKLALTFTQNCPSSSVDSVVGSINVNSCQMSTNTDVQHLGPEWSTCLEPNSDLSIQSRSKPQPSSPLSVGVSDCFSQTEPQDFAFLWRLSNQNNLDEEFIATYSQLHNIIVLSGNSSWFKLSTAAHSRSHREVPYRVVHDKSTQLEDKDLGDLEWTTNLLLDSGEIFFKEEDVDQKLKDGTEDGGNEIKPVVENATCPDAIEKRHTQNQPVGIEDKMSESDWRPGNSGGHLECTVTDKGCSETTSLLETSLQTEHLVTNAGERTGMEQEQEVGSEVWDEGLVTEEATVETEDELASMEAVSALLQAELNRIEEEEKKDIPGRRHMGAAGSHHLDIQSVELKLPTEVALQLIELFGPVGVDPDSTDDCAVQMDLNLAKLLHQKWKESVQEKQRQATLSFLSSKKDATNWQEWDMAKSGPAFFDSPMPFIDHWKVSQPSISLRDIIKEEQALQDNMEKKGKGLADLDGASLLKENQLYALFPSIDRHFLQAIFRDHNYSLTHTELFLRSLLDEEPVKTVVAPQAPPTDHHRANSGERELKQKPAASMKPEYQDTEDPEYEDFRAEASLQRKRRLESFAKAAEAFKQGRKEVASFYAQQGHMHGKRMSEANHRAAVQIFERVNSSLLPNNILDLHGLHVDEALDHLVQVLHDKTTAYEKGLCRPQLSVITGRGNHSQGGVARIRPAVINYLTNANYRFTEPKPGLVLVSLK
ncbi:NEDD4-binding protein 2 isoform X2 [Takifugu flavidus]|uniref:NEDD4-binding protein 2 isoform X2 n=1 Tax=Takifugu flavidus TaxID=433684 RepID=UPI002544AAA0|nr:NEDD4-binding protein 2 isoform X2 [Takifugu flavidus]